MAAFPTFGAGSTLGPLGNAGPATSGSSGAFNPVFSEVNFSPRPAHSPTVQSIAPMAIAGAIVGLTIWLILK